MPAARRVLLALGGLYALVNAFIGIHSGGDFVFHLRLAERLLQGQAPYADFNGAIGLPWPPFAIVTLVPFALLARLSLPLTKAVWAIGNVALFGWWLVLRPRPGSRFSSWSRLDSPARPSCPATCTLRSPPRALKRWPASRSAGS